MGKESKKMCKWKSKHLKKELATFAEDVRSPQYVCTDCLRVAHKAKRLCHAVALPDPEAADKPSA